MCSTSVSTIPERYEDLPEIGTAMSPDMEVIASLNPDWILSPSSLQSDLQPKYEAIHTDWAFLNLRSVQGMYQSIQELGEIFGKEEKAAELEKEFTDFYEEYKTVNQGKESPKVLILMGLPGILYHCNGKLLCGKSCGDGRRRKCICRNRSGISDSEYRGYEVKKSRT
ncbi:MAG: ABC transporter substrate-binding protein [Mediterraneibacter gnavus]